MTEQELKETSYYFTFSFKVGGIVDSEKPQDEVLESLKNDLTMVYGPEGFEITEFRPATEEEIEAVREFNAYDNETPTLN